MTSFLAPKATRAEDKVKRKLQNDKYKAYNRYEDAQDEQGATELNGDGIDSPTTSLKLHRALDSDEGTSNSIGGKLLLKLGTYNKCWIKFFGVHGAYELKWKEFFCLTFCLQVPLAYCVRHVSVVKKWGASIVLGVYVCTVITIGMPVYMVYMFLGNYSRRSYIKFWECVPLMKGVAYSVAITSILMEMCNVSLAGLALLYIKDLITAVKIPWLDCKFAHANPDCMPLMGKQRAFNKTCCRENDERNNCTWTKRMESVAKYSTFDYYYSHKLLRSYEEKPITDQIQWKWMLMVEIIWVLIFLLMMMGLRRFRGFMTTINLIIFTTFIPICILTLAISPYHATVDSVRTNYSNVLNYKFWSEAGVHTLHRELPGDIITFSSVSSPGISTTVDTVTVYVTKLLFITLLTVWVSLSARLAKHNYKLPTTTCIQIDGDVLIFALIPDLISRMIWPKIWLVIYFAIIFFWGFSTAVYVMNSFLVALLEAFPTLQPWRPAVSLVLCLITGTGNAFMIGPHYMDIYMKFLESTYVQLRVTLLLFSMMGMLLYSIERFKADYHFIYGRMLGIYWVNGIKVSILLVGVLFSIVYFVQFSEARLDKYYNFCLTLLPIVIWMAIAIIRYFMKMSNLITPDPSWGPPGRKMKLARQKFDPTHNLRYNLTEPCTHDCLIDSEALQQEVDYWKEKKYNFLESVYLERKND